MAEKPIEKKSTPPADLDRAAAPQDTRLHSVAQGEPRVRRTSSVARKVIFGCILALCVVFLATTVFTIGLYRLGWRKAWVERVITIIPFPAALANSTIIRMSTFREDVKTLEYYFDHNPTADGQTKPSPDEIRATVLNRLLYDSVVDQLVRRYHVSVAQSEIDAQMKQIAASRGGENDISELLATLYGWSEQQFQEKILRPYLALQKLETTLTEQRILNGDVETKARDVLAKVRSKEKSFEEYAKEYSEDTTASVGGDLGFFSAGDMDEAFQEAVDALEPGGVSDLVQTQYGYHIIQLVEKVDDTEKGTKFHARHILFLTKSIDEYINDRVAEKTVRIFVQGLRWDSSKHWAEPVGAANS
jgi:hypothetical protein